MEPGGKPKELNTLTTHHKPAADPTPSASIYHPLPAGNFFRILHLEPGHATAPIQCRIEIVAIDDVVDEYEAISYVWGDPIITERITCNVVPISVTTNLADALRTFRFTNIERVVWADAICINQQDIEERTSQVEMMEQVFAKANGVLAWLGRDPDDQAKQCFHLIAETNKFLNSHYGDSTGIVFLPESHPICQERKRWMHVDIFLKLPYFRRVWVVQEVAIAKQCALWWGTEHMSVAQLFEFVCWYPIVFDFDTMLAALDFKWRGPVGFLCNLFLTVYRHYRSKVSWQSSLPLIKLLSKSAPSKNSTRLVSMLEMASNLEATDPRDRIYALLASPLAKSPHGETLVKPNYNLAVEDVYFETACALLQDRHEACWLLGYAERHDRKSVLDNTSPSWIPLWHIPPATRVILDTDEQNLAGGIAQGLAAFVDHGSKTLQVSGSICDKIVWLSDNIQYGDFALNPSDWSDEVQASGKPLIDTLWERVSAFKTVLEDDFVLTMLVGSSKPVSLERNHLDSYIDLFALYRQHVRDRKAIPKDNKVLFRLHEIEIRLGASANRRLAVTEGGHLALVSGATTRIGDVCCVILGMHMPFILTPEGQKGHRLVCPAYIRGFMNGEIAQEIEQGVREKEVIIIT